MTRRLLLALLLAAPPLCGQARLRRVTGFWLAPTGPLSDVDLNRAFTRPTGRGFPMKKWPKRIRGAFGMGLTWAIAWFGAGVALLLVVGLDAADVPFLIGFGMFGFLAGVMFSGVLGIVEGRRRFDQMSVPRFAGWGAVGGLLLSGTFVLAVALLKARH